MKFQRARTQEQIDSRQSELVQAADKLYSEGGFEAVNFNSVSALTSFSRPTIYNYYKSKEEILLDVLKQEYLDWLAYLKTWDSIADKNNREVFCEFLTDSLRGRDKFLTMLSVDFTHIESGCSIEKLTEYKKGVHSVYHEMERILDRCFINAADEQKDLCCLEIFSLIGGLFPLVHLSEKQRTALETVSPDIAVPDFYDMLGKMLRNITITLS